MVLEPVRSVRFVTFALLALASFAVELAATDGREPARGFGLAAAWALAAALAGRMLPPPADPGGRMPRGLFFLLAGLAAAPFVAEPLRREWTGDGHPFELQMVCGLRNIGLGLASFGGWTACLRLACVTSLFLVLFAAVMTSHPVVMAVLVLYALTGGFWLALVNWSGLRPSIVTPVTAVEMAGRGPRDRMALAVAALLVLPVAGAISLVAIGPTREAFSLGEWLPSSGGSGETDPFARHGMGDGPEEAAGANARAAGMVESDRMIEDNKNALIDAISDMYGPPHKPPKDQERMVAAGLAEVIQNHGKLPENRRPSRDFDTSRQGPGTGRKPESRDARGLFEIEGRTPLHIRVVAWEEYDAAEHRWNEARKPGGGMLEAEGGDWMRLTRHRPADWYAGDERHRLKSADMDSNLAPTPTLLARFRIKKVSRPDDYEWEYDGVLALAGRRQTPPGVVITTDCRTVDFRRLPESAFPGATAPGQTPVLGRLPEAVRPELERIAREWAGDLPRGPASIDAVLRKLRDEHTLDPGASAPSGHPAPVLWFLNESRRGPDYLFATAAALLLRALDHPTRVCLGYYAAPEAYDPETAHTPVRSTDLHFWPEVLLADGQWLVVEPTPGHRVLEPKRPLSEEILELLTDWPLRHPTGTATGILLAALVWFLRRRITDFVAVCRWKCFPGKSGRAQVAGAVALLERRGRRAGKPRADRQTISAWLRATLCRIHPADGELERFAILTQWAAYAPESAPSPLPRDEALALCRSVVGRWTAERWHDSTPTRLMSGDRG